MKSSELSSSASAAPKRSKKWRNMLVIFAAIGLVGWIGSIWLTSYLEKTLQTKVTEMGMRLTFDEIHWHLFPPGVSFDKLHLQASENDSIYSVNLDGASVELGLLDLLSGRYQQISKVKLHDGRIEVYHLDSLEKLLSGSKSGEVEPQEKTAPANWEIANIDLSKICMSVAGENGFHLQLQSFTGSLQAQYLDSAFQIGVLKKPVAMTVTDCNITTLFNYHGFHADTMRYDMKAEELRSTGIKIFPKVSRDYLHVHEPHIVMHADITAHDMVATGFVWTHTDHLHLKARKVVLNEPVFVAYQDKNKPLNPGIRPMPPCWIEDIPFKFLVDSLHIHNGALTYTFTRATEDILGRLALDKWDLLWLGYGNDNTCTKSFTAQCNMRWMNATYMQANVTFPYGDPKSPFEIKGSFTEADFAPFNSVMEAAEGFHFETGHCNSLRFAFTGDETHITGKMWINYDNVKIGINKVAKAPKVVAEARVKENLIGKNKPESKREPKEKSKRNHKEGKEGKEGKDAKVKNNNQRVMSFIANALMVRASTKGEIVEVAVYADRNQQQSVISLWLKGLMTGLKSALMRS